MPVARGDLNGDNHVDLLWENTVTGERALWAMTGTTHTGWHSWGIIPLSWRLVGAADLNYDGEVDLLWANTSGGEHGAWTMNKTTAVGWLNFGTIPVQWRVAAMADFDDTGTADIVWENTSTGEHGIWLMAGVQMTGWVDLGISPLPWRIVAAGDFNGDGKPDLVWENPVTGARGLWLMNKTNFASWVDLGVVAAEWRIAGAGDFNADGQSDIVWENSASGERGLWLMNGAVPTGWVSLGQIAPEWRIAGVTPLAAPTAADSEAEAARFLIQATFGPTASDISRVRSLTYSGWIAEQVAMAPTYHLPYHQARVAEFLARSAGSDDGYITPRQEAWWQHAVAAPDQLRQRMAFALSEILVISQEGNLNDDHEGVTAYYDILVRNAFGNYRQLLEEVTLSPMMGSYLSMIRNRKPNLSTGSQPDENYAREIMQLFSIGLSQLNLDGTVKLGADGLPLPTYNQADILGLAHVFTGWGPHFDPNNPPRWNDGTVAKANDWFRYGWDPLRPMTFNANFGDLQNRQIVGGVVVPGSLPGPQRLQLALDTLFNHPNVGPFIGRQLIQRFVTSNPNPAYIRRVAAAFNDNGAGVRGDLGATIRAVLLDPEARRKEFVAEPDFGKMTEPLLRMTRLFRAFPLTPRPNGATGDNRLFLNFRYQMDEQSPLFSPTVFNFFKPDFAKAGPIQMAGLVSPEFQIYDDVTAMLQANRLYSHINSGVRVGEPDGVGTTMKLDLAEPLGILMTSGRTNAESQAELVDYFNRRLLGGHMSPFLRQKILDMYASLPASYSYSTANQLRRVQAGLYLVMFSPEFNIQR